MPRAGPLPFLNYCSSWETPWNPQGLSLPVGHDPQARSGSLLTVGLRDSASTPHRGLAFSSKGSPPAPAPVTSSPRGPLHTPTSQPPLPGALSPCRRSQNPEQSASVCFCSPSCQNPRTLGAHGPQIYREQTQLPTLTSRLAVDVCCYHVNNPICAIYYVSRLHRDKAKM